jgi:DNA-binding PadR family transcriptional regulator
MSEINNQTGRIETRKDFINKVSVEDFLDEDPVISNQKFFVMSYILPESGKNELSHPIIKVRGSYSAIEDCEKRIEKLKNLDKYNNMFICEVGKYGALLHESEFQNNDEIDVKYREAMLNTLVKEYKENKDKTDQEFEKRKEFLKKRAEYEGTIKGQEELKSKKENPVSIKARITNMTEHYTDLQNRLKEIQEIINISQEQLDKNYTQEEIEEAEKEHQKNTSQNV